MRGRLKYGSSNGKIAVRRSWFHCEGYGAAAHDAAARDAAERRMRQTATGPKLKLYGAWKTGPSDRDASVAVGDRPLP
jgi:hypothetical protein